MFRDELLLRTRLAPPRPYHRVLPRPTLTARLKEAFEYRLTLVQAGTGYGKTTALAALAESGLLCVWYSVSEDEADPQRFLSYLIAAFRAHVPHLSDLPQAVLQEVSQQGKSGAWPPVVNALVNALADAVTAPLLLIVDDYHFVSRSSEINSLLERFLTHMPPAVHVLLATRYPLTSPALTAWRVRGEVLEINREALVFQPAEIETLFRETYGMNLTPDEVAALTHKTEGWPIALQLVWQGLRGPHHAAHSAAELLASGPNVESLSTLFDYLAFEVLGRQPGDIAAFLRDTAVLRELTPGACAAVTQSPASDAILDHLHELDLFVVSLGERHYRYQHLFHDFLRQQWSTDAAGRRERHQRAAAYFRTLKDFDEAIYHALAAQTFEDAAANIEAAGDTAVRLGRLDTVAQWIDALPPDTVAAHPLLQRYLGDVCRLRSRFDEALAWYQQAEQNWRAHNDPSGISRALRGQALVYLDTVRPAQAESLLEEALRYMDGLQDREARARMLELLAENKLNMGKPGEAERLHGEARTLRAEGPAEDVLSVRVKLRTGQLDAAQQILESWATAERQEVERGQPHVPRAHRETVLILSLIHALRGKAEAATHYAEEGIALGERLNSPFVTAVAHIRLGHARQLLPPPLGQPVEHANVKSAIDYYQRSIALGDKLAVRRTRAEAQWGLTRAYGFGPEGDLAAAERAAAEGVEVGCWAGDPWLTALVELTLGASYVLAGKAALAVDLLGRVLLAFRDCGDSFGRAATRLWLSLAQFEVGQKERAVASLEELLTLCETHGYDFLFTRPSLLSPPDPRRTVPLLLEARARRHRPAYVARLLAEIGLPEIKAHPGYQLRVQTLGAFRVWRGAEEIDTREWKRDKARQLFQLLLTERGQPLQREAITERLWPALAPEAASRDFKVALNALYKALEPARSADAPSAYITREGATYTLRPEADLWLDAAQFELEAEAGLRDTLSAAAAIGHLQSALRLYQGDYLPEALYEDWATEARERWLALYLRAADKLAGALIEQEQFDEGLAVCHLILARDPCWERAYRLMMAAYARQGNRPQALRTYQRCVAVLKAELEVEPSAATLALYQRIAQTGDLRDAPTV